MNREERILEYRKDEHWDRLYKSMPHIINSLTEKYIYCPYCGEEQQNDDGQYPVTYWGTDNDEGTTTFTCQECEKDFTVEENVERAYQTIKMEEVK